MASLGTISILPSFPLSLWTLLLQYKLAEFFSTLASALKTNSLLSPSKKQASSKTEPQKKNNEKEGKMMSREKNSCQDVANQGSSHLGQREMLIFHLGVEEMC